MDGLLIELCGTYMTDELMKNVAYPSASVDLGNVVIHLDDRARVGGDPRRNGTRQGLWHRVYASGAVLND